MSQSYDMSAVASHNKLGDLWVVIDGDVYDLSKFGKMHPGGEAVLKEYAGKDATEVFFEQHRLDVLRKYQRLKIGRLAGAKDHSLLAANPADAVSNVPYAEIPGMQPVFHSPYYTDSHKKFRIGCRAFVSKLQARADQFDRTGKEPTKEILSEIGMNGMFAARLGPGPWMKQLKALGITLPGGVAPEEFDQFHELIAQTEFSRLMTPGFIDGIGAGHLIGVPPIMHFGSPAMKEKYTAMCLKGEKIAALAITEPFVGSDVAGMRCTAKKSECGKFYIVNGAKKWITNGTFADLFVTAVRTGGKGAKGISMLMVERSPGLTTKLITTAYSPCAGTAYVEYNDVKVPVENLMGREGDGFKLVMHNFNHERWVIIANTLAQSRFIVEECFKWATQRVVFGKKLIDQPVIRFKFASMIAQLESVWSWLETITHEMNTMDFKTRQERLGGTIALCKYQATRVTQHIVDEAVQIFGGRALTKSGMGVKLEAFSRFVKYGAVYGGSEEICADLGVRQAMRFYPKDARL
ncbi:Acyl-CoA dehydrogenase [Diplonema papillatum]|nr:Acyl-CoA dehydrogenase [Diplonema papillatum]